MQTVSHGSELSKSRVCRPTQPSLQRPSERCGHGSAQVFNIQFSDSCQDLLSQHGLWSQHGHLSSVLRTRAQSRFQVHGFCAGGLLSSATAGKRVSGMIFCGIPRRRNYLLKMSPASDYGSLSGSGPVGNLPSSTSQRNARPSLMLSKAVWGEAAPYPGGAVWGAGRNPSSEMAEISEPLGCVSVCEVRCPSYLGNVRGAGSSGWKEENRARVCVV